MPLQCIFSVSAEVIHDKLENVSLHPRFSIFIVFNTELGRCIDVVERAHGFFDFSIIWIMHSLPDAFTMKLRVLLYFASFPPFRDLVTELQVGRVL